MLGERIASQSEVIRAVVSGAWSMFDLLDEADIARVRQLEGGPGGNKGGGHSGRNAVNGQ